MRRRQRGQAVLEMALCMPLMLALIFNFVAIMVLVVYQQRLETAVTMAATSTLDAKLGDRGGALQNAQRSFNGTFGNDSGGSVPSFISVNQPLTCSGPYLNGQVDTAGKGVTCTATATIDFKQTPLGFAVFWEPKLTATITEYPSPVRQCPGVASGASNAC